MRSEHSEHMTSEDQVWGWISRCTYGFAGNDIFDFITGRIIQNSLSRRLRYSHAGEESIHIPSFGRLHSKSTGAIGN